jgi:hypothetical protein
MGRAAANRWRIVTIRVFMAKSDASLGSLMDVRSAFKLVAGLSFAAILAATAAEAAGPPSAVSQAQPARPGGKTPPPGPPHKAPLSRANFLYLLHTRGPGPDPGVLRQEVRLARLDARQTARDVAVLDSDVHDGEEVTFISLMASPRNLRGMVQSTIFVPADLTMDYDIAIYGLASGAGEVFLNEHDPAAVLRRATCPSTSLNALLAEQRAMGASADDLASWDYFVDLSHQHFSGAASWIDEDTIDTGWTFDIVMTMGGKPQYATETFDIQYDVSGLLPVMISCNGAPARPTTPIGVYAMTPTGDRVGPPTPIQLDGRDIYFPITTGVKAVRGAPYAAADADLPPPLRSPPAGFERRRVLMAAGNIPK